MKKKNPRVEAIVIAGGRVVDRKVIRLLTPQQIKAASKRKQRKAS